MSVMHLTNDNFDSAVSDGLVLLDFWAEWCGPCRMQAPVLDELDKELEGKVKICKVDVDENPNLARRFGVMSIPTLIAFKDGEQLEKRIGLQSREELLEMLG